jgi:xanthine dehydrogenase iron-sulfur cluster and FAD-binding subunit A
VLIEGELHITGRLKDVLIVQGRTLDAHDVEATVRQAMAALRAEFSPISDMRASATYRSEVLGNLLQRYWLESQGLQQINLATFRLEEAA